MSTRSMIAALAALGSAATLLASCAGPSSQANLACPKVISVPETQTIAVFGPNGHDQKDVRVGGRIRNIDSKCEPDKVGLAVLTSISFEGQRADLSIGDTTLPYFVAVVDPDEKVLKEQGFNVDIKFLPGEFYRRMPVEEITVHLPVTDKSAAGAYTVVVGFRLTPEQMAFNRSVRPK